MEERIKELKEKFKVSNKYMLTLSYEDIKELFAIIEELKKPKYVIDFKTNEITKLTNDFVSKDKIKAKIEIRKEEKKNCKDSIEEKYLLREIYVLQSLLEKE